MENKPSRREYEAIYRENHREENRVYARKYYNSNKDQINKHRKILYHNNIEKYRERSQMDYVKHKELRKKQRRASYHKHKVKINKKRKEQQKTYRAQLIFHYSNGKNQCACCGEHIYEFLTIDECNGIIHKTFVRRNNSSGFYRWLINNNFPKGFQVLCMNCNWGRGQNRGICPHKSVK